LSTEKKIAFLKFPKWRAQASSHWRWESFFSSPSVPSPHVTPVETLASKVRHSVNNRQHDGDFFY
jgi:hypothetical protein